MHNVYEAMTTTIAIKNEKIDEQAHEEVTYSKLYVLNFEI